MFVGFMIKKNILFLLTFYFGLCSLVAIPCSQGLENTQYTKVWKTEQEQFSQGKTVSLSNVQSFVIGHVKVAKRFLKSKVWMPKNFTLVNKHDTPNVILRLPQSKPLVSEVIALQPGDVRKPVAPIAFHNPLPPAF